MRVAVVHGVRRVNPLGRHGGRVVRSQPIITPRLPVAATPSSENSCYGTGCAPTTLT